MTTLFLCLWPFNTSQIVKLKNTQKFIFLIFKRVDAIECLLLKKRTLSGYVPLPNEGYIFPQLREKMKDEYIPDNDKLEKLSQTVKRCNTSGIKLYLVVSPTYAYKPVSFQSILQDLSHIANDNDTGFYDFSSDSGFLNDSTLFKDNVHLNDKGARKFTQYILDIL